MTQTIDSSQNVSDQLVSDLLDEQITSKGLEDLLGEDSINPSFYRYNLVSKILQDEMTAPVGMDFVNSVSQKLDAETTILAPSSLSDSPVINSDSSNNVIPLFSKIKKMTGGMAIAASVAVATFVSVQSVQVANDGAIFNSELATTQSYQQIPQKPIKKIAVQSDAINPANYWSETAEQKQLEFFNDMFMSKARQSEQESIAPFARAVRGQSLGTIRFSKEQWENILRRSSRLNEAKKIKEETQK